MSTKTRPVMKINIEHYQRYLDDTNISDTDKEELLETLWSIICELVELGYGVHPLQENCGESNKEVANSSLLSPYMLDLHTLKLSEHFTDKAQPTKDVAGKESKDDTTK